MSVYANPLGVTTPGLVYLSNAGQASSIPAAAAGAFLSTGSNTYTVAQAVTSNLSGCVAQLVSVNVPSSGFSPYVTSSLAYNSAAQFLVMNITPVYATSTYLVEFSASMQMKAAGGTGVILSVNGYLNAAGTRLVYQQANDGSGAADFTICAPAVGTFTTGSLTPFTFNFCATASFASSSTIFLPSDYFTITEINPVNYVSIPANSLCVSTGTTPVTSFTLPSPASGQSIMYQGNQTFIDQANVYSNVANFALVVQQPGNPATTAPTIAANTVLYDSVWLSPTLTFTPVVGGILAQVVGIAGSTFLCQNYVTSVVS